MTVEEQRTMHSIQKLNAKIPEVTLRDLFAMNIISGMIATNLILDEEFLLGYSKKAYKIADAMLEARGK